MEELTKQSGPSGQGRGLGFRACVGERRTTGETSGRSLRALCAMPWSVNFSICGGRLLQVAEVLNGRLCCRE